MMNPEWQNRLQRWREAMPRLFFVPLGEVLFEGFTTFEQLTPEQARAGEFRPFPPGTAWGAHNEYGWFRASVRVPETAKGERIVLRAELGPESLVWINGSAVGSRSWADRETILTRRAEGGEAFAILMETGAGNGTRHCGGGPAPLNRPTVPETPATQATVKTSEFGIWEEDLYQLWLDAETLWGLRESLHDRESLRLARIDAALQEMTLAVDFELPRAQMLETVRRGRALLRPALEARNGSSAPAMHAFGHAHLDLAWLWPVAETDRKCGRTFSSQLTLMEEYPEYKFLQSQPHLYEVARRLYPEVYARVREAVRRGQWIPDGAMWVEADTNVPCGESLIRQFLYGKRFFRDEFGVDSRLMWLPDVFGYSGALPQIMKGCGVDYFSTQKIFWCYNGGEVFPFNWFWWQGIDGTRVLSYIHNDYNSHTDPKALAARWHERTQKEAFHSARLLPFGWGDGGGGPVRDHVEYLRRQRDLEGSPRCATEAPEVFFDAMNADGSALAQMPTWVGELYLQIHRGTYTTQARTKKANRACEGALRELELWGAAAARLHGRAFPAQTLEALWKDVLFNQFHDILPGSSVHQVYEEAEAQYARVLARAGEETNKTLASLCDGGEEALTLFNSLSWERSEVVELPAAIRHPVDASGRPLPTQHACGKTFVQSPAIPPMGWVTIREGSAGEQPAASAPLRATPSQLENEFLRITLNERGELAGIWDKEHGIELAAAPCNALRLYKDVPAQYDAWDIDSIYKLQPVPLESPAEIEVATEGPLETIVRVKRTVNDSLLTQEIVLRAGSRRVDFRTTIDWRERHKMLKVAFPVAIHADHALHEIQFGYLSRPNHASRIGDASRFEVCQQRWTALAEPLRGAAVLNDCKYGVHVEGNSIHLTLLRSPLAPDMTADLGVHSFTYAFYAWAGCGLVESGLQREAQALNTPLLTAPGSAAPTGGLLAVSAPNVIAETVKLAEDGSGDLVVRLYEAAGAATRADLSLALPATRAAFVNMLEEPLETAPFNGGRLTLEFRPFEIKTLRFS